MFIAAELSGGRLRPRTDVAQGTGFKCPDKGATCAVKIQSKVAVDVIRVREE